MIADMPFVCTVLFCVDSLRCAHFETKRAYDTAQYLRTDTDLSIDWMFARSTYFLNGNEVCVPGKWKRAGERVLEGKNYWRLLSRGGMYTY